MKLKKVLIAVAVTVMAGGAYAAEFNELAVNASGVKAKTEQSEMFVEPAASPVPVTSRTGGNGAITVESRIDELPIYSPQSNAITMGDVCKMLENRQVDLGKTTTVRCIDRKNGVIELEASDTGKTPWEQKTAKVKSILANATDKTRYEAFGSDDIHQYINNLGQTIWLKLEFLSSGVTNTGAGVYVNGTYRADFRISDKNGSSRFGFVAYLD